jgi:LysM repeat protein
MIQKDLKIGLFVGLVLVIAVIIKLAVDPRLSPEARITQLNNSVEGGKISDSNESSSGGQNSILSEISSASEPAPSSSGSGPAGALASRPEQVINELHVQIQPVIGVQNPPASGDNIPQLDVVNPLQKESFSNTDATPSSVPSQETSSQSYVQNPAQASRDIKDNLSAAKESNGERPENFDYEKAEVIKTQKFHFVLKNETLSDISRKYYGSTGQWKKIVNANPDLIKDPNKIKAGMKLIIP